MSFFFLANSLSVLYDRQSQHSPPRTNKDILNIMGYGFMTVIQQYCNVQLTHQTQN